MNMEEKGFIKQIYIGWASVPYSEPFDAMTIEPCDIPFPKYSEMSCGHFEIFHCIGLENGCNYLKLGNAIYGSNSSSTDSNLGFCLKYQLVQVFEEKSTME